MFLLTRQSLMFKGLKIWNTCVAYLVLVVFYCKHLSRCNIYHIGIYSNTAIVFPQFYALFFKSYNEKYKKYVAHII